ncbi:urea amidolyase-like [Dendronephthya gigantea]|uniref:urea amidolyase-like n=1 Tax=Dendronephthya gigantea TaxID=151771 RepID=UPI00106B2F4A|nr:urea amidolyase-like [Dendronephthya gigantea]
MVRARKILIANRGVCASRIVKTCKEIGIGYTTIFTEEDYQSLHVTQSEEKYLVTSYMDIDEIIRLAKETLCDAIIPGYGFQAENPTFPRKCSEAGIIFVGPTAENMLHLGCKIAAKRIAEKNDVSLPTAPSSSVIKNIKDSISWATIIGYPVLLKPANGGGGIGIMLCENKEQLCKNFQICGKLCAKVFGNSDIYMEKYIPNARHIEVQVFGDGKGNVINLGERECSVQRRYQKLIEESPSTALTQEQRDQVCELAVRLCKLVNYQSVGTVEFIFDDVQKQFFFLEVNTRLQVEHRVTELRYCIDLVELMIRHAYEGTDLTRLFFQPQGHAIECRVYAENVLKNFMPSTGLITEISFSEESNVSGSRLVDTWVQCGCLVSSNYDSLLANIIQLAPSREQAIHSMLKTLNATIIAGPLNNLDYFRKFLMTDQFVKGETYTNEQNLLTYSVSFAEVIAPGLLTTVQDWPGRQGKGLWRIGVPPSGPMDHLASRVANRLVNNKETDAVLEITQYGPTLKFHLDTTVVITGASMETTLDDEPVRMWQRVQIKAGSILKIGNLSSNLGSRAYFAVAGGINVPKYLGSRATFPNGNFGGYQGRALKAGDMIAIGVPENNGTVERSINGVADKLDPSTITGEYGTNWSIGVLPGPHDNPEYLTDQDMHMFYTTQWRVHQNSNRLGIRLCGPSPEWARPNGGEGGNHPSNIHDCEYAIGTVNFTGNMPIIIGQDGPSLGGFVCPCTIVQSELWKIGQVKAGDTISFFKMTIEDAIKSRRKQNEYIRTLEWSPKEPDSSNPEFFPETKSVLRTIPESNTRPRLQIRMAGDSYILIEYGPMVLDLNLRFRVHILEQKLLRSNIDGLEESAPGVRSLQLRYNPLVLSLLTLIEIVTKVDNEITDISDQKIPTRILNLPMCFNYSGVNEAIEKYMKSVRAHAPYLPSNIEYIFKNNGLQGVEDVMERVFSASYMCIGLGDVYLGACCAVPVNPLHRLITSKYNPARTYTQEGTVGLGGSYMCIYPMNSPGGYQLIGRTLPIWNTFGNSNPKLFRKEKPWMLQMFDQIRFFPVSEGELDVMRSNFKSGALELEVENEMFDIAEYNSFVHGLSKEIECYRAAQKEAVNTMLKEEEKSLKLLGPDDEWDRDLITTQNGSSQSEISLPKGTVGIFAPVTGKIWEIALSEPGEAVLECQVVATVEAMKMECPCYSPVSGTVRQILTAVRQLVNQGDLIMIIDPIANENCGFEA